MFPTNEKCMTVMKTWNSGKPAFLRRILGHIHVLNKWTFNGARGG